MSESKSKLRGFVLEAVSNDYENLETILKQVQPWALEEGSSISRSQVIDAIEWAINEGYAEAYLLFPVEPHVKEAAFSRAELSDLWFRVTAKGKKFVEALE
jgi:hypothetical protein